MGSLRLGDEMVSHVISGELHVWFALAASFIILHRSRAHPPVPTTPGFRARGPPTPQALQRRLEVGVGPRRGVPVEKDSLPAIKADRSALQDGLALLWRQPGLPPPEHLSEVLAAVAEETIP
eukprot:CAMPEP_0196647414 /NCGR_PEP_ID=MMETSP1085-20130531/11898_1 /TAXON_ID=41879 ORGANISM="Pycnococcus sp, Strain CCMP1998" /NCGR_SAMPLE_ID=MMETSP1085 /ASSEMBLY_ACC=CAM_ASM_000807 /LENGTH=121 /DNA_ID=CAMNT_0041977147 /DNA_START=61 /DNA_END=424 /DNA_ORIENTATION=+